MSEGTLSRNSRISSGTLVRTQSTKEARGVVQVTSFQDPEIPESFLEIINALALSEYTVILRAERIV